MSQRSGGQGAWNLRAIQMDTAKRAAANALCAFSYKLQRDGGPARTGPSVVCTKDGTAPSWLVRGAHGDWKEAGAMPGSWGRKPIRPYPVDTHYTSRIATN